MVEQCLKAVDRMCMFVVDGMTMMKAAVRA